MINVILYVMYSVVMCIINIKRKCVYVVNNVMAKWYICILMWSNGSKKQKYK